MLQPQGLSELVLLGTPAVHPNDKELIVLAKAVMSMEHDAYDSRLVLYDQRKGTEQPLLPEDDQAGVQVDHSPKWSADGGMLAYLRRVQGRDELWIYDRMKHTVRSLTPQMKVKGFTFAPDGRQLVFTSRVNDVNNTAYRITRLRYKFDGEGMTNGYTQLFSVNLDDGEIKQLTTRNSDHGTPLFSSNGKKLIYVSEFPEDDDLDKFPTIHTLDMNTGMETSARPDVKSITTLFNTGDGSLFGIGKRQMAESTEIDKWFHWDPSSSETRWYSELPELHIGTHLISDSKRPGALRTAVKAASGNQFLYIATFEGRQSLYMLDLRTDAPSVTRLPIPMNIVSFDAVSIDGDACVVVFVGDSMRQPGELYRAVWTYGDEVEIEQLTNHHAVLTAALPEVDIQEYWYETTDGSRMQGWSITPKDHDGRPRRIGTQLWIHGGPHLAYGDVFHYDFWYWASCGYRVIFSNPRGSTGYGQAFARAIVGQWARIDVDDLFGFMDKVLEAEGRYEDEPLYLLGGSYGGYLVNWIVAHDHRFTAAVTERSICNLYSKVGNSDNGFYNSLHQLGGDLDLWSGEDEIMARSPIRYAPQVETPVLIIHAEQDHRCPIEQAEQWYTALRRLGKKTAFIRLPGASHAYATAGKPLQRVTRFESIGDWLSEHAVDKAKG